MPVLRWNRRGISHLRLFLPSGIITDMRISRYRKFKKPEPPRNRVNDQITVPEVRLIDENGTHIGVVPFAQAGEMAKERGLDLVEIDPKPVPPIIKMVDYGQFKYEKEKESRKQKAHAKTVEVKGVRLSVRIGEHDRDIRRKQAIGFLEDGDKVQVEIVLRGREKQHADLAARVMHTFFESLNQAIPSKIEQPISKQGGRMTLLVARVS